MLFLVLQKDGREGFAGIQLRLTLLSHSDTDRVVPFADDSTEEDEEQEADCPCGTGRLSEDYSGEQWLRCAKYLSRAHTLCAGIKTLYVSLVTDNL